MSASTHGFFKGQGGNAKGFKRDFSDLAKPFKKVALLCHVLGDGLGDFGHLLDLLKCKDKILPDFGKDIIIESDHTDQKTLDYFKNQLEKQGIKTILVNNSKDFATLYENSSTPTAYLFPIQQDKQFRATGWVKDHASNIELIQKKYSAAISISKSITASLEKIPHMEITEHCGPPPSYIKLREGELNMNLSFGTQSIFLNQEDRANPEIQLLNILSKPENIKLKSALLGNNAITTIEDCKHFLEKNQFVPCYFQHNDYRFIDFLNIVQASPLSQKFDGTTFFVNKINVAHLEKACQMQLISKDIKNIIIQTSTGEIKQIENPIADEHAKTVKFIAGYRINDDEDYNALYHCAQHFAGASGDKTLEKVLANGLIPLFIPHNDDKNGFIKSAAQKFPLFKTLDLCLCSDPARSKNPAFTLFESEGKFLFSLLKNPSAEAKKLDENFFKSWKELCETLRTNHNLYQKLPTLIDNYLIVKIAEREFMDLIQHPNTTLKTMTPFLDKLEGNTLENIGESFHRYFMKLFIDDKPDHVYTNESLYEMICIDQYLQGKTLDMFKPKQYLLLAEKLLESQESHSIKDLELAKQCLQGFLNASKDKKSDMFIRLNDKLNSLAELEPTANRFTK